MSDTAITLWLDGALRCVLVFPPDHQELAVQVIDGDHAVVTEPCGNPNAAAVVAQQLWTTLVESRPMPRHLRAVRGGLSDGEPLLRPGRNRDHRNRGGVQQPGRCVSSHPPASSRPRH